MKKQSINDIIENAVKARKALNPNFLDAEKVVGEIKNPLIGYEVVADGKSGVVYKWKDGKGVNEVEWRAIVFMNDEERRYRKVHIRIKPDGRYSIAYGVTWGQTWSDLDEDGINVAEFTEDLGRLIADMIFENER